MAQAQNNVTTLFIPDPNGGQPQMIKVMGGAKLPFQITTSGASSSTYKTFIKTSGNAQPGTIVHSNKIGNRQLIALPTKPGVTLQGIRGPMVVPVSSVQIKNGQPTITQNTLQGQSNSPFVIRTQAVSANSMGNNSVLPQISITNKHPTTLVSAPILSAQLKQIGSTNNRQTFTVKTQQITPGQKQPEMILMPQQKFNHEILHLNKPKFQHISKPQFQQIKQEPNTISPPKSLMNTSILDHSGNRKRQDFDFDYSVESKRRKTEKGGKGLRHFSMKVCEKVKAKGTTSYNEVADELVNEFSETQRANSPAEGVNYDQKNIRRRVYDALNVLMAMNIISKEKKEIRWLGLPTNSLQECHKLEQERKKKMHKIKVKKRQLQDLILQQIAFKNLVERNRKMEENQGSPTPNSAIQLPFIIVNTNKKTVIDCSISNDKTEYLFNFDDTFEIQDDIEVLKRRGLALGLERGACTDADLEKARSLVPKALEGYVTELAINPPEFKDSRISPLDDLNVGSNSNSGCNSIEDGDNGGETDPLIEEDFIFEKLGHQTDHLKLDRNTVESGSPPSSFGDFDDGIEDSDVEIN